MDYFIGIVYCIISLDECCGSSLFIFGLVYRKGYCLITKEYGFWLYLFGLRIDLLSSINFADGLASGGHLLREEDSWGRASTQITDLAL